MTLRRWPEMALGLAAAPPAIGPAAAAPWRRAASSSLSFLVASTNHGGILLVLVDGPVEDVVVLEALADEEIAEQLAEVRVVGLVVETEGTAVVEVDGELVGEATAEYLGGSESSSSP